MALVSASPVHYQVPLYRRLAADPRIDFTAIYASSAGVRPHDPGYCRSIIWDVDLLAGYRSEFLRRATKNELGRGFLSMHDLDVLQVLDRGNYEVVWLHGYNTLTHQLALLSRLARRTPVLFREEQTLLHGRAEWKLAAKRLILPHFLGKVFGLYIGTENRFWLRHYGVPENHLFFTPYAVENERFQDDAVRLADMREETIVEFGLNRAKGPVILFVGRLIDKKQPLLILEAFRRLRERSACRLLIVGSGPLEDALHQTIKRDRIPDVRIIGFLNQSQVSRAYSCGDIFVLASRSHETWGLVVNEAMNFGLPVVVSDKVGCAADLVQEGNNGFVVSSNDPAQLAARLGLLVESISLRRSFGEASLRLINQWTHDVAARGVIAAVQAAVGERRWLSASVGRSPRQLSPIYP
jgi:glycosyltransferase involved in cell wall biosynthesis